MAFKSGKEWAGNKHGRPATVFRKEFMGLISKKKLVKKALEVMEDSLDNPKLKFEAARYILDQATGKAPQTHEIGGLGGEAIISKVIYADS